MSNAEGFSKPLNPDNPRLTCYLGKNRKKWLADYSQRKGIKAQKVICRALDALKKNDERSRSIAEQMKKQRQLEQR